MLDENQEEKTMFQRVISFPHSLEDCEELEEWGRYLCDVVDMTNDEEDSSQQFLMNWILKNIPTVAMFCNKDGNVRVNILSSRIYPSIFLDHNFKYLILEKMMAKAETDGIQRFSTITWQKNENFGCDQLPFNIYFVKRGYFAFGSCHKSIIPFEGDLLKKWRKIIISPSEMERRIIALIEFADIQQYLQLKNTEESRNVQGRRVLNRQSDRVMGVSAAIAEAILTRIGEEEFQDKMSELEELLNEIDKIEEDMLKEFQLSIFEFGVISSSEETPVDEVTDLEKKIRENIAFDILCNAWICLTLQNDQVYEAMNQVKREYQQYTDAQRNPLYQQKKERIADYLMNKAPYKFSKEQVLQHMDTYEEELLILFHDMECRRVRQKMSRLFNSNRYLTSRLIQRNL